MDEKEIKKSEGVEGTDKKDLGGEPKVDMELVEKLAHEKAIELTNKAISERLRKVEEKAELEKAKAIEEAIKKEKMTEDEKKNAELEDLRNKYSELEDKYNSRERIDLVRNKFIEAKLPMNDILITSLSKDLENVDTIISKLKEDFEKQVQTAVESELKNSSINFDKTDKKDLSTAKPIHRSTAARIGTISK